MSMDGRCVQVHKFFQNTPRRTQTMDVASHPLWSSVDLVETLLLLADAEGEDQVLPLFTAPLNTLVCVCVCVCVCVPVHVYMYTCIYKYMHIYAHTHKHLLPASTGVQSCYCTVWPSASGRGGRSTCT